MTSNITERIRAWFDQAVEGSGAGQELAWEATVTTAQGPAGPTVMLMLSMWGPSPVLGELLYAAVGVPDPLRLSASEEAVGQVARGLVEQIRASSSATLQQALSGPQAPQGPPGQANGRSPS